jgi:ATP diphosphatase
MTDSRTPEPEKPAGTLVPPAAGETPGAAFAGLVELMRLLRGPGGCPWDHAQTLDTLKPFVLEEAHEVIDAIERRDMKELRGEIGDLLFEGVFLAQVSADEGGFTITEALRDVHEKLVRRHPHVFADVSGVNTPDRVKGQWEQVKAVERAAAGKPVRGVFDGIPKTLPALLAAYEIGQRAAATGFDWHKSDDVIDKIEEEVREVREAVAAAEAERVHGVEPTGLDGPRKSQGTEGVEEEVGDLLFAVANLARKLQIEPEAALRAANRKFTARFGAMQQRLESQGLPLGQATLNQMEQQWQAVKQAERTEPAERAEQVKRQEQAEHAEQTERA